VEGPQSKGMVFRNAGERVRRRNHQAFLLLTSHEAAPCWTSAMKDADWTRKVHERKTVPRSISARTDRPCARQQPCEAPGFSCIAPAESW
jgi:hypothetical protein